MTCQTDWKRSVKVKVVFGEISGSNAKDVSPTRPLVTLVRAASLTCNPNFGATIEDQRGVN